MSSDPDEFTRLMKEAGFAEVDSGEITEEVFEYTSLTITYETDNGLPVTVRVAYPVDQGMDAARALVVSGGANGIRSLLAGGVALGDASIEGYFDANGIDAASYVADAARDLGSEAPPLSDADEFFTL